MRQPTPSPATANPPTGSPDFGSAAGQPLPDPLEGIGDTHSAFDPDTAPLKLSGRGKRSLKDIARGLVLAGTAMIHQTLARTELEKQQGVWLMDSEEEAAGVGDPLASIVGRRAGASDVNPDMADLIEAGLAAAGYVIVNVMLAFQIRRTERQMRKAGMFPTAAEGESA